MNTYELKKSRFIRRKKHIRKNIFGTCDRLRLSIYKSAKHIYAQIIDDNEKRTLASSSTIDKEVKAQIKPDMTKKAQSKIVGTVLAKRAADAKVTKVAFDRNGFLYHGRVKELAEAARKGGLDF